MFVLFSREGRGTNKVEFSLAFRWGRGWCWWSFGTLVVDIVVVVPKWVGGGDGAGGGGEA